jgi:hypothetical protein
MVLYVWSQDCKSVVDCLICAVNQSVVQLVLWWGANKWVIRFFLFGRMHQACLSRLGPCWHPHFPGRA